jgi:hypothetical protein
MKNAKTLYFFLLMFGVLFGSFSCTPGIRLNTQGAQNSEVTGTYTVIYYGCNFLNDLETIAFLDREDGKYPFEPYAPDFEYRVKKGLSAKEAMETAMKFVSCNASFNRAQVSEILGPNGEMIGYEVRPLYQPFTYGAGDFLLVNYSLKDGKVVINLRLRETMLQDSGVSRREK